ncbi:hypothetical protein [Caulobacter endophyticus]|uniref:hypothetical protein n=1 Tax=Caulobacter endophyticus TaxID=2172652 RepID=UPI0024104656|nr:hypothetical protein [Caulobacter endophyticus]MDG2527139.1 hypothetical protein [Caulobacter endophyticus]
MLRFILIAAATAAFPPVAALADTPAVAQVEVSIGPDLAAKADKLGAREFDYLARDLKRTVERRLTRSGGLTASGGRLNLVIDDATPNRPTPAQLTSKPGLSMESFGNGGARISGEYVTADGVSTPIRYHWYEQDIWQAQYRATWTDANIAFDQLARRIEDGRFVKD